MHRLRRRDRCVGIAHRRSGDHPALENERWFDAKKRGFPQHQVGELARFHRTDNMRNAVRNRGVDGVFRNVAFDARIVVRGGIAIELAALLFHFVCRLPGANDHLANAAHRLRVR